VGVAPALSNLLPCLFRINGPVRQKRRRGEREGTGITHVHLVQLIKAKIRGSFNNWINDGSSGGGPDGHQVKERGLRFTNLVMGTWARVVYPTDGEL
jgi:hypothetical protein